MKRKAFRFLAVVCMGTLSIAGCAKTPDQALIAQKNNERLEEIAKKEPQDGSSLKDIAQVTGTSYDFHYESEDGKVKILAENVPVTLPNKDKIPMYHVNSGKIPQELADRFYDYFFPDGAYSIEGTDSTKAKIDEQILEIEKQIALNKDDLDMSEEEKAHVIQEHEKILSSMKEQREKAPEESTLRLEPRDSQYEEIKYSTLSGEETVEGFDVVSKDQSRSLSIISADTKSQVNSSVYYSNSTNWDYQPDHGILAADCSVEEKQSIGITQEEATAIVHEFIDAIGLNWEIHDVFCVSGYKDVEDEVISADSYTAYQFALVQSIDGIQSAITSSTYVPEDEAAITWLYEQIDLIVEPSGIVQLKWLDPLTIKDTVSENVGVISFDAAKDIFENMMPLTAKGDLEQRDDEYMEASVAITVFDARLALMRVRNSGSDRTGLMTPVWLFYGDYNRRSHYLPGNPALEYGAEDSAFSEPQPWILLAINAVDGSVIDITEGY